MKAILHYLKRDNLWPLFVVLVGALLLLPGLGSHGFWEPYEIRVADRAGERVGLPGPQAADAPEATPRATEAPPKVEDVRPPLTEWSAGQGMKYISANELGARLPLALLGMIALVATFFLGRRLAGPRAGLIAALVMATSPLFLFQARQLMSNIGAITGSTLVILGLVGLLWPGAESEPRSLWRVVADVALVVAGTVVSYLAAAALLGVLVPFGAVALASLAALIGKSQVPTRRRPAQAGGGTGVRQTRRWAALAGLGLLTAALAVAVAMTTTGAHLDDWLVTLLAPTLAGMALLAVGVWPAPPRRVRSVETRRLRRRLAIAALITGAMALAALYLALSQAFDLRDPVPGERALLGRSLLPGESPAPAIGGIWKLRDDLNATFDVLFEQIAFGLFPWVALAPIAIAYLGMGPRRGRSAWGGFVLFAWALLGWVIASIMTRKVAPVLYPALAPVAVAVGIWLDNLLSAREQADATTESDPDARASFGIPLRPALAALFALLCGLVVAKDIAAFPDRFIGVAALDSTLKYPVGTKLLKIELKVWVVMLGILFSAALAGGLLFWTRHRPETSLLYRLRRHGVHAALGVALVHALFLGHCWTPEMSRKLSSKHVFSMIDDLRQGGGELGIMGNYDSSLHYYAGGNYTRLAHRPALIELLGKDERVFALAPVGELCAIHREVKGKLDYHVLDDSNAKFLLLSNRLGDGEKDRNPLSRAVVREQPQGIKTPLRVDFDGRVELIGVDMPELVERGARFQMTLYYRVLKPVNGNWKIFVHFDGAGMRFQGDHEPIAGRCGTSFWQPGDYIVDTFTVEAGNFTYAKTAYTVYTGFFRGSHGNWTNMKIVSAATGSGAELTVGSDDRVRLGQLKVQ